MLRQLSSQKRKALMFRDNRPHLLVNRMEFSGLEFGVLKVSGYLRGRPLSVNSLVHIPGVGNCQMSQVRMNSFKVSNNCVCVCVCVFVCVCSD